MNPPGGLFVTFEGVEGSGKSTLLARLAAGLQAVGLPVTLAREPGTSRLGEVLRGLVLDPQQAPMDPRAELFLMLAARAQLVHEVVRPALARGQVVLCDRYGDASVAYQGAGRGLGVVEVAQLNQLATGGLVPSLTLLVDLDPARGRQRMRRPLDRLEAAPEDFHRTVRDAYLALAAEQPDRFVVLDGDLPAPRLAERAWSALATRLPDLPAHLPPMG